MLEVKYATYHLALLFPSPLSLCVSFPFLHYYALSSSILLHPLNSSSLLPSTFFPLPLPSFSPGSGTFPSLHWLPIYLQGTNWTARTGEGTCMNKQLVRNNILMFSSPSPPGSSGHWYSGGQYHQYVLWNQRKQWNQMSAFYALYVP